MKKLLLSLLIAFVLASCVAMPSTPRNNLGQTEVSFTPTKLTSTPDFVSTNTPEATSTEVCQPTFSLSEKQKNVTELMLANDDCVLPCWWGIHPGKTPWATAQHRLLELTSPVPPYSLSEGFSEYAFQISDSETEQETFVSFYEDAHTVHSILILSSELTGLYFSIPQVFLKFGKPEKILVLSVSEPFGDGVLPFFVILDYTKNGFQVVYEGQGIMEQDNIQWCNTEEIGVFHHLGNKAPSLLLWDPHNGHPSFVNLHTRFPNLLNFKEIENVTNISAEDFYTHFDNENKTICIYSPTSMWGKITDWVK